MIDSSNEFYIDHSENDSRSLMNITFQLRDEQLEQKFLTEAKREGFVGLNAHQSVGGCRASTYNAVPYEACKALSGYMTHFPKINR